MSKNKQKPYDDRVLIGGRFLALGDEKMGKTHLCHDLMANMIQLATNGYYVIYLDKKGDSTRYKYFNDFRYIKNIKETKYIKDNAFVLDMFTGGSLKNSLVDDGANTDDDVLIDALIRLEEVSTQNPLSQMILFINECHNWFPEVQYNGKTAINKTRLYFLQELNHIKTFAFLTTPDTRPISKMLISRSEDIACFRVQDARALDHLAEISRDYKSNLSSVPIDKIQKLQQKQYVMLKNSGRFNLKPEV